MKAKNNEAVEKAIIITSCILCGLFFLYGIYKTVEEVIRGKYEPELIEKLNTPTQKEINKHPNCIIGYVSSIPSYDIWGKDIKVNNRIWIKIV